MYVEIGDYVIIQDYYKLDGIFLGKTIDNRVLLYRQKKIDFNKSLEFLWILYLQENEFEVKSVKHNKESEKVKTWYHKNKLIYKEELSIITKDRCDACDLKESHPKVGYLYYTKDGGGYIHLGYKWGISISKEFMDNFNGTVDYLEKYLDVCFLDEFGHKISGVEIQYSTFLDGLDITKKTYDNFKLELNKTIGLREKVEQKKAHRKNTLKLLQKL